MQRSRSQYGLAFLALVALGCGVACIVVTHFTLMDGIDGESLALLFGEDTVYAPGYTDRGFRAVENGMSPEMVERILGKPLEEYQIPETGKFGWRYARSANSSHYRIRSIVFDRNRLVVARYNEFYVD